jgi:phage shock protein A
MTELERQLTAALRKLSAQYETEQRRHTEQVEALQLRVEQQAAQSETLRRQIEQLSGHVTGLDADYKTIAATLREW